MSVKEYTPISIRLPQPLNESLELACSAYGRSKSDLIRQLLAEGLIRLGDPKKVELEIEREQKELDKRRAEQLELAEAIQRMATQGQGRGTN